MKRESFIKKNPLPTVAIAIGVLAIAGGFWRQTALSDVQTDGAAKEQEAARLAENVRYGQKLDSQLQELRELNKQVQSRLTDPADLAANQHYFYRAEAESGVKITELRRSAQAVKKAAKAAYSAVSYTVTVEGSFGSTLAFLRNIEKGTRISRIVAGNITTRTTSMGDYNSDPDLNCTLEVEFLSLP